MRAAPIYTNPIDFSRFMAGQLENSMQAKLVQSIEDPLRLEVTFHGHAPEEEKAVLHLHNVYDTYRKTGDLNAAIDFLNNMTEAMRYTKQIDPKRPTFNPDHIYPVLRPSRDIRRFKKDGYNIITYAEVPGMETVILERNVGFSTLINEEMLNANKQWDKQSLKRRAYQNMRSSGWKQPNLQLQHPFAEDCEVLVYLDPPVPVQCQLLLPDMTFGRLPEQFIAAFPNKETTLIMKCRERLDSMATVKRIVRDSQLRDVVDRSYRFMPYPLTRDLYWISNGRPLRIS